MTLFHSTIHMPESIRQIPTKTIQITDFGSHAIEQHEADRYCPELPDGCIQFSTTRTFDGSQIFEAETTPEGLKICIRQTYTPDPYFDLTSVILFRDGGATLKTVWLNCPDDDHKTLNPAPYATHTNGESETIFNQVESI